MSAIDGRMLLQQAVQHHQNGAVSVAEALYKKVLNASPNHPIAAYNLALLQADTGRVRLAQATLQSLLRAHPNDRAAHHSLAKLLERGGGSITKSLYHLRRAVELVPGQLEPYLDLIRCYGIAKRLDDARDTAQRANKLFPDRAEVFVQLGVAVAASGRLEEAKRLFAAALDLTPDLPLALYNLARIADEQGEPGHALQLYRSAFAADHESKLPDTIIGHLELKIGAIDAAIRSHETWLARNPSDADVLSSRMLTAQYEVGATAEKLLHAHKTWDTRFGQALRPARGRFPGSSVPGRRLRVGLVSSDLRQHPVGYFTIRAIEALDPEEIELVAYSGVIADDPIARRFKLCVSHWRDTFSWSDAHLASEVGGDHVDILIDLAGDTSPSRLATFARRPAPLQITWAGYPGTTGLSAMDALIADRFVVPPDEDRYYVEKVLRLPDGFICFDPPIDAPPVSPLPAGSEAPLTFASFHNPAKINREVVQLWARMLKSQPGARIWFIYRAYDMPEVQERIRGWFAEGGISGDGIIFEGRLPRHEYLERYHCVDVALDPFPFSGGTITCDALWMGVPVVTLPGQTFASRHSLSHLSVTGLTDMIARDADDYVSIVNRLSSDRDRLSFLRSSLRDRVACSPLCDGPRFARHLQAALHQLWNSYQQEPR